MFTAIPATPTHRLAPVALHHRSRAGTRLNIDLVFPIRDEISAWLMCLKAESLCEAGIISDNELDAVIERAAASIGPPEGNRHIRSVRAQVARLLPSWGDGDAA
jgi:hypothetical protein